MFLKDELDWVGFAMMTHALPVVRKKREGSLLCRGFPKVAASLKTVATLGVVSKLP